MTHPITPPTELMQAWVAEIWHEGTPVRVALSDEHIAARAAQWGADQELKAVCQLLFSDPSVTYTLSDIRAARRPKPPSLKGQALKELAWVDEHLDMPLHNHCNAIHTIRRALEQLND
jgi:hypothetical protein